MEDKKDGEDHSEENMILYLAMGDPGAEESGME